jgi:predicted phosphate transport protein (TIGR00153 family)
VTNPEIETRSTAMELPFGKTRVLESQVDTFLDTAVKAVLELKEGVGAYLAGKHEEFENRIKSVSAREHDADELRKHIKNALYAYSLLPESRGDVLALLEKMDNVVDDAKEILQQFDVQRPDVPEELVEYFLEVTDKSVQAVDNVVSAARCYLRNPSQVKDYINKVDFYESEADRAGMVLKKKIFRSEAELAHKLHLRYFAELLESISDTAEDISERLGIAVIKRSV